MTNKFEDMEDDLPWANQPNGSVAGNTEILEKRGFTRGCWLLVTYHKGEGIREGTHLYKYVRAVKGDLGTIIVRDAQSLQDFRLNMRTATIVISKRPTKKQGTRLLLLQCVHGSDWIGGESYKLRSSRGAVEENGLPICPCGRKFELVE